MKTRGKRPDYKILAGVKRPAMTDESEPIEPTLSEMDEPIVLSSADEELIPPSEIKQEEMTDEEQLPLNVRLTMKFAEGKSPKPHKNKPEKRQHPHDDDLNDETPTCSKYLDSKHDFPSCSKFPKTNDKTNSTSKSKKSNGQPKKHQKKSEIKQKLTKKLKKVKKIPSDESDSATSSESSSSSSTSSDDHDKKKILKKRNKTVKFPTSNEDSSTSSDDENQSTRRKKKVFKKKKIMPKLAKTMTSSNDSSDSEENSEKTPLKKKSLKKKDSDLSTVSDDSSHSSSSSDEKKQLHKNKKKNKSKSTSETSSSSDSDKAKPKDNFLTDLNDTTCKTSRDLKTKVSYKLLKLKISNEIGFNGTKYKKAIGKLQEPKTKKIISIVMPRPIANYSSKTIKEMTKRIAKGQNPCYTVKKITSKKRPDKKGHYDMVDFKWT